LILGGVLACLLFLAFAAWGLARVFGIFDSRQTLKMQCITIVHDLREAMASGRLSGLDNDKVRAFVRTLPHDGRLIIKGPDGWPCDIWGNRFHVKLVSAEEGNIICITSDGPDGIHGTADDLTYSEQL
jgi:hypothetical protein